MSIVAIGLNLLLVVLLGAALTLGWRLNLRLKALRSGQEGFAQAVAELNAAARRAEQGLAELRAASDEASEALGSRVETARTLASRLERLIEAGGPLAAQAPKADEIYAERRLGALLASVQQPRSRPEPEPEARIERLAPRRERGRDLELVLDARVPLEDDLFDAPPARTVSAIAKGGRR